MTAVNPYPVYYRPAFASFHLLHPPGPGLALRLGFRLLRGLTGLLSFALLSNLNELGSSFPPATVSVCRADLVASRRAASRFGSSVACQGQVFSTFRLFPLTRFIRTSRTFAISFRPSLLAALVLAAMTAAFRQAVSARGVAAAE